MKEVKARLKLVWTAVKLATMNPKLEIADTMVMVQWDKLNECRITTRSVGHIIGLLLGQVAVVKNSTKALNVNNQKFIDNISTAVSSRLTKTEKNTPVYNHLHVRKVRVRPRRSYR